jgi:ribosomal-protein-alanine N-acetyltransferase
MSIDHHFESHPTVQQFKLASMKPEHLDAVAAIESESFTTPWSRDSFARELTLGHAHPMVCLSGDTVIGYVCPWLTSDEVQILRLAVASAYRRRGAAATMMNAVIDQAYQVGAHWIFLEFEEGNHAAESLYQGMGFTIESIRPDYYGRGRHALVMVLDLEGDWDGEGV